MDIIYHVANLLTPDVWAIYLVGFLGFGITIWQLNYNFKLRKKAETFDELAKDIREASTLSRQITNSTNSIINDLAAAADDMVYDSTGKTEAERKLEDERRIVILTDLKTSYQNHSNEVYTNIMKILNIIKNIEKSTVVKNKTRTAARYLFYAVDEQHQLMKASNDILESFKVVPPIDGSPNIAPEPFRAVRDLIINISQNNGTIGGYLDDMEIILHNDLVKRLYGKAKNETLPTKHLTPKGFIDTRTDSPLL